MILVYACQERLLTITKARSTMVHKSTTGNFTNPMSQLGLATDNARCHTYTTFSKHDTSKPLGTCTSSVINSRDDRVKKMVNTGLNSRLPTIDISEKGNPHAMSNGTDIRDKKSCNSTKRTNQILIRVYRSLFNIYQG